MLKVVTLEFECARCHREAPRFHGSSEGEAIAHGRDAGWSLEQDGEGTWHARCPSCTEAIDRLQEQLMNIDLS